MSIKPALGDYVTHSTLGIGKVVSTDTDLVRIYFRDSPDQEPEQRVKIFKESGLQWLTVTDPFPDLVLDNLPPWKDGRFQRYKSDLSISSAKASFLHHFPNGIGDQEFTRREIDYKRSAHLRYQDAFAPFVRDWIAAGDHEAILAGLEKVYGDPRSAQDGPQSRLNLLYQKIDEPAYFDALRSGGDLTVSYAKAAVDFIEQDGAEQFVAYASALAALPTRKGGTQVDSWPTLTWLPFIADPQRHFPIKPTVIQSFASALVFEPNYSPLLNHRTYSSVQKLAQSMRETLRASELNLQGRELDMIDVQSFMWVVARYTSADSAAK